MTPIPDIPDPTTIAAVYLAQDMLRKILGPTADYLGDDFKERLVERRKNTVAEILSNAEKKLGPRLDSPGRVSPKVLKEVLNDGSYAEDPVSVEYIGGVLASSRTADGRDDRGARIVKMVDNLSVYQLRTHYLIYSTVAYIFAKTDNSFALHKDRIKMNLFFPTDGYINSMGMSLPDLTSFPILMSHIFHGLSADGLILENWAMGEKKTLQTIHHKAPDDKHGIILQPSSLGAELFLAAFGHGDKPIDYILSGDFEYQIPDMPPFVPGAMAIG